MSSTLPTPGTHCPLRKAAVTPGPYIFLPLTTRVGPWVAGGPSLGLFLQWQQDTEGHTVVSSFHSGPALSRC